MALPFGVHLFDLELIYSEFLLDPRPGDEAIKVVQYRVLFDVDSPDGVLRPQMTAQVAFVTAQAKDVLVVPLAALRQGEKGWQARVLDAGGKPVEREVVIAARDRVLAEVVDGLAEGESLVTGERVEASGPSGLPGDAAGFFRGWVCAANCVAWHLSHCPDFGGQLCQCDRRALAR